MITTIIFDLAEVLLKGTKGIGYLLGPMLNLPPEQVFPLLKGPELESLFHGQLSEEEYWQKILHKNQWKLSIEQLKEVVRKNFQEINGTRAILEKLKQKGYKLGLLSVHAKEWVDHCDHKYDYHKLFHSICYSFEIGISKSDKKSYLHILQRLQATPTECLFIDDKEVNLAAARELGLQTLLFRNADQLKKDLPTFSIRI